MEATLTYKDTAFYGSELKKFDSDALAKADVTDLRLFTGCNFF